MKISHMQETAFCQGMCYNNTERVYCVPFGESKNGFLILDLPDFTVERNVKSQIGFVTLVTFRQRVQYARQPLKNDVFSTV